MKLLWCCLLATLISTVYAAVDVEKTVRQVQSILKANVELPRLTREEILQLLNDIRAEDAKSKSTEQSQEVTTKGYNSEENEINPITKVPHIKDVKNEKDPGDSTLAPSVESTTKKGESTVMVVLPYTPRDGSSLQELYTRPPRVEVVPASKVTPSPNKKLKQTLENNAKLANKQKLDIPAELQAFLDSHGLKGKPGQDHFLLPLEGFKPLPPAKIVDGTVQLPENILLTYDLVPSNSEDNPVIKDDGYPLTPSNYFPPIRPEIPFELDTSSSETKKTVIPYDLPTTRKTKSTNKSPNYEPIDYDSVKVLPLQTGISPVNSDKTATVSEPNKRQANESSATKSSPSTEATTSTTSTEASTTEDAKNAPVLDSAASNADSGASIADLEDSFGGAAPEKPGDSELPPPRKNGFYWMLDWNSFLEVGDGDSKVNIRFEPKLGDPQMFLPVNVP